MASSLFQNQPKDNVIMVDEMEAFKSVAIQACLVLSVENRVNFLLGDLCLGCKHVDQLEYILDHQCLSPDFYKAFVWAIFSDYDQLLALRDDCYNYFVQYCQKTNVSLQDMNNLSPFDGCLRLIIYNKTLVDQLQDIVYSHTKSGSPQTTEVMKIYYLLNEDLLCETDLRVSHDTDLSLMEILKDI